MLRSLIFCSAIMLAAGAAQAGVTMASSEAAFISANPTSTAVDFAGIAADGGAQHVGTPYDHGLRFISNANHDAPGAVSLEVAGVNSQSNAIAFLNNNMSANDASNAPFLTTTFNNVSAAAFLLSQGGAGKTGNVGVSVRYAGAINPFTAILTNVGGADSFSFVAIDGFDRITSVTFSLVPVDSVTDFLTAQNLGIGRVLYATDALPVPEPGSLALLAGGLLGLAWSKRRAGV